MFRWIGLALAVVAVLALLWNAGENHYRACVDRSSVHAEGDLFQSNSSLSPALEVSREASGCSRWPW
jgi:hypothetical protein